MTAEGSARPRYATRPTPGARHDAAAIYRLSVVMGKPLMPWQRQVMRVGTERALDDPSRYRYRLVVVSVPRQSGKTAGAHVKNSYRTIRVPRRQAFYTAQTGKDARERWMDCKAILLDSPLGRFIEEGNRHGGQVHLGAGSTAITWPNGSTIRPFAPTAESLHGYTPDFVDEDECWAYDEVQGEALDGAIGPAQITLPHAQRWLYSTMGDADSTWWHRLVEEGRVATEDPDASIAYFEWSADPDRDLYDPAHWADFHPALGHTIAALDLAAEAKRTTAGTWQRAFCNLRTATRESIVDMASFDALGKADLRLQAKGAQLAFDVAHDQSQASIALARPVGEDSVAVRIVKSAPGVAWLADDVIGLCDRWGIRTPHADDGGPARDVTDELRRRGREVTTLTGGQFATASGAWLRRTRDGRLQHDASKVLHDAMAAAKTRPMGDALAFSRRHSAGPIDALVAGCVAVRAALLAPPPPPAPLIRSA